MFKKLWEFLFGKKEEENDAFHKEVKKLVDALQKGDFKLVTSDTSKEKEYEGTWEGFIEALKSTKVLRYPWLKEVMLSQAILESGRGTSPLAEMKNFNGMKYRESLAYLGGEKFKYYTNSEPKLPDGSQGWAWFFRFKNYDQAISTWQEFFFRKEGTWIPYPKVYKFDSSVLKDSKSFLDYIGPIYCPYFNKKLHGGKTYAEYIYDTFVNEAKTLLGEETLEPPRGKKIALVVGHRRSAKGAVAYNGISEYDFNTKVANKVKEILDASGLPIACRVYSRTRSWNDLKKPFEEWCPDIACELHFNSFHKVAYGCEVLVLKEDVNYLNTLVIADEITDRLSDTFEIRERGVATVVDLDDKIKVKSRELDGIKQLSRGQRGSICLERMFNAKHKILIEPCFANKKTPESEKIIGDGGEAYAKFLADSFIALHSSKLF